MTCERRYTDAVVADLQRIATTIEAERRRQYRAEMAQELRERISGAIDYRRKEIGDSDFFAGWESAMWSVTTLIEQLSPPVACDNETE